MCRRIVGLICLLFTTFTLRSQPFVFFWNTENWFDTADDPLTADEEFTPRGEKHWTRRRLQRKTSAVAKTIAAAADRYGDFPTVVAFAEVENRRVLYGLLHDTPLEKLDYEIIHRDGPDRRGIDVAMLYRREQFQPLRVESLTVPTDPPTRDILYVKGVMKSKAGTKTALFVPDSQKNPKRAQNRGFSCPDTLHLIVVHWPSKMGGAQASQARREAAAATVKHITDSLRGCFARNGPLSERSAIVVTGDFNDTPDHVDLDLDNLALPLAAEGRGTLRFRGNWELIDQFHTVSRQPLAMDIFAPDFLLEQDKAYCGRKPKRTWLGPRYNGGVSDHLPIVLLPAPDAGEPPTF